MKISVSVSVTDMSLQIYRYRYRQKYRLAEYIGIGIGIGLTHIGLTLDSSGLLSRAGAVTLSKTKTPLDSNGLN